MDALGLAYYAIVCGALTLVVDRISGKGFRLVLGLLVGLASAALLPFIRTLF